MAQHNLMMAQQKPSVFQLADPTMKHSNTTTGQIVTLTKTENHQHTQSWNPQDAPRLMRHLHKPSRDLQKFRLQPHHPTKLRPLTTLQVYLRGTNDSSPFPVLERPSTGCERYPLQISQQSWQFSLSRALYGASRSMLQAVDSTVAREFSKYLE